MGILQSVFLTEIVLPFLLVFVVMFAVLQKSKILGDKKNQIDALVALAIALILIGVPGPRDIVVGLMPWLVVGIAVILVFLMLYGFVAGDLSGDKTPDWLKTTVAIIAGVFVLGLVVYTTGLWDIVASWSVGDTSSFWVNGFVLLLVVGAVVWVVIGSKKKD